MKVTLITNKANHIKRIITDRDESYIEAMKEAEHGVKYWGWMIYTTEAEGYIEVVNAWKQAHHVGY